MLYASFLCIGYVPLFFVQVKESISVISVILLVASVATLMSVVSYYVDSVCMQR
jgi:threonine/homoserine efflux transporter RhtA